MNDAVNAAVQNDDQIPVRYEFDQEKMNRKQRRQSDALISDAQKKYRHVRGPNGERPSLILRISKKMFSAQIEAILEFPEAVKNQVSGADKAVFVG